MIAPTPTLRKQPAGSWSTPAPFSRSRWPDLYREDQLSDGLKDKATPAEYWAGLQYAIGLGWLEYHESGTFARMLRRGKDLFA